MATISSYENWWVKTLIDKVVDLNDGNFKVALVTSSYTPDAANHDYFNDITNEVSGTNYTAGGAAPGTPTVSKSGGTTTFDAADVTWSQSGAGFSTARYAILYYRTGTASTSPLMGYIDFGGNKGNTTGDLTIQWGASGIFTIA